MEIKKNAVSTRLTEVLMQSALPRYPSFGTIIKLGQDKSAALLDQFWKSVYWMVIVVGYRKSRRLWISLSIPVGFDLASALLQGGSG